ncbi:hypothetical protein [Devosia sediminis]|uniref:Uncharacterized protein n=1 Tax=Devosia sediminis TaxID=2798801 RepID=A0A934MJ19_9HYPH|nr:hypothetical protein [Devosia sediminis]MBJ3783588.1 hypothetical protein [Devosia sediminis]
MPDDAAIDQPAIGHPLYIAWGRVVLHMSDQGITAEANGLRFTRDGRITFRPYTDIVEINLAMNPVHKSAEMAQMTIRFFNGLTMRILNTTAWGNVDADQTQHYYRFKADLHERLIESGAAANIAFTTGYTSGRGTFLKVALAIGAIFFIGTPIVIFLMTGQAQALLVCVAGAGLILPFYRASKRNEPGRYDPRSPPDMLA